MMTEAVQKERSGGCNDSCLVITVSAVAAASYGADVIYYGATAEDVARIPGLKDMLLHIQEITRINTGTQNFRIEAPMINKTRVDTLSVMMKHGQKDTWSCHWGGLYHCGKCEGCENRKERLYLPE
jgi:7-cyano-7-deazaguanine synthase in queuosine biosynthesis